MTNYELDRRIAEHEGVFMHDDRYDDWYDEPDEEEPDEEEADWGPESRQHTLDGSENNVHIDGIQRRNSKTHNL